MIDLISIGKKIQGYREQLKMNQEQLAEKLFVTRQAVSRWETGLSAPSIDNLLELSNIFNISFEELLCLKEPIKLKNDNIFAGHDRLFIIKKVLNKTIDIDLADVFYQFSSSERMIILTAIKNNEYIVESNDLWVKLTTSEKKFLGGKNL